MNKRGGILSRGVPHSHLYHGRASSLRRFILNLQCVLAAVFLCGRADGSAPPLEWSRSYNGLANSSDSAYDVCIDRSGNIIVVGKERFNTLGQWDDWMVRKYDQQGNFLWSRTHNGRYNDNDQALGVDTDLNGNIYVAGFDWNDDCFADQDWLIRKYSPNGDLIWSVTYCGTVDDSEQATSIAVDGGGNVIVVGYEKDAAVPGTGGNCLVRKYDPGGNLIWSRTYNGFVNYGDSAGDVAIDSSDNIIVGGFCDYSPANWLLIKYDSSGNELWTRTYAGLCSGNWGWGGGQIQSVAVDASGNILTAGALRGCYNIDYFWLVEKLNSTGNLLWSRTYSCSGESEGATAVEVDRNGDVYVAGYHNPTAGFASMDWIIMKYSASGEVVWSVTYNSPKADGGDTPYGIAVIAPDCFLVVGDEDRGDILQASNWLIRKYCSPESGKGGNGHPPGTGPDPGEVWVSSTTGSLPVFPAKGEEFVFRLNAKQPGKLCVRVYGLLWEKIAVVFEGDIRDGPSEYRWDGRNKNGQVVAAGTYLVRFELPGQKAVIRRIVIGR